LVVLSICAPKKEKKIVRKGRRNGIDMRLFLGLETNKKKEKNYKFLQFSQKPRNLCGAAKQVKLDLIRRIINVPVITNLKKWRQFNK
jgi:hypothetical protein